MSESPYPPSMENGDLVAGSGRIRKDGVASSCAGARTLDCAKMGFDRGIYVRASTGSVAGTGSR